MLENPEQKPTYFQDVVIHEEAEKAPEGFDLDREFGRGTREAMEKLLRTWIEERLRNVNRDLEIDLSLDLTLPVWYRILFGKGFWTHEEQEYMEKVAKTLRTLRGGRFGVGLHFISAAETAMTKRSFSGESQWNDENDELYVYIEKNLREQTRQRLMDKEYLGTAFNAAKYRVLFDKVFWSHEEQKAMEKAMKDHLRKGIEKGPGESDAVATAVYYRLLRAHEINFIPGKGIEIIDTPPQEFQKKPIPPMPEERKF